MRLRLAVLGAALAGCTALIDLDGPPREIGLEVGPDARPFDAAGDTGRDSTPLPMDAGPQDAASRRDATWIDSGPSRVLITDLRGLGGTHQGTRWEGRALRLASDQEAGSFTSRIFAVDAPARWVAVRWYPEMAYGRPLPDGGGREQGYPAGDLDMGSNVLLLHLDDLAFDDQGSVSEASGAGHRVRGQGGSLSAIEGVFGGGLAMGLEARLDVDANHPAFRFGDGDFTWSLFARSEGCQERNSVFMGGESRGEDAPTHLWLGCNTACEEGPALGGTIRPTGGPTITGCGRAFADGRWHHLAVVKQGHHPADISWHLDGERVGLRGSVGFGGASFDLDGRHPFTIGSFPGGRFGAEGAVDEVAIWHRALDDETLRAIAARGLGRIRVYVRACISPDCAADPPFGPALIDDFSGDDAEAAAPLNLGPSRWIQYRVEMEGRPGLSPALLRVELEGEPE